MKNAAVFMMFSMLSLTLTSLACIGYPEPLWPTSAPTIGIDPEGEPVITVKSADSSMLTPTKESNKAISSFTAETFTEIFRDATSGFRLDNINITDGVITLTGRAK